MLRSLNSFHRRLKVYVMPTEESTDIDRHITATGTSSSNDANPQSNASLLDQQFNTVVPGCFLIYVILQIAIGLQHQYSDSPICSRSVFANQDWVHVTTAGTVACLLLTCVLQVVRILSLFSAKHWKRNLSLIRMNTLLLTLIFISATSKILTFGWRFGGICVDSFGVVSPAAQWAEWLVLVPLLQYAALAGEQKNSLDRFDITMLLLLVAMLVFGFALHFKLPLGVAVLFLLLSVMCLMLVTFMTYAFHRQVQQRVCGVKLRSSNYLAAKMTMRKDKLLIQLNIILWYYPLIYLLGMLRLLPPAYQIAGYMLGSMFGKVIFSSLVVESQITMLYEYLVNTSGKQQQQHVSSAGPGVVGGSYTIRSNNSSSPPSSMMRVPGAGSRIQFYSIEEESAQIDAQNASAAKAQAGDTSETTNEVTTKSTFSTAEDAGEVTAPAGSATTALPAASSSTCTSLGIAGDLPDTSEEEAQELVSVITMREPPADEKV